LNSCPIRYDDHDHRWAITEENERRDIEPMTVGKGERRMKRMQEKMAIDRLDVITDSS